MRIKENSSTFLVVTALFISTVCAESRLSIFWRLHNRGMKTCEKPELQCWSLFKAECFNPSLGEICNGGRVACSVGYRRCPNGTSNKPKCVKFSECCEEQRCGKKCYNLGAGESCTSSGLICQSGLRTCGKSCFNPETQKCHSGLGQPLICKKDEELCFGVRCYSPHKGQKCYNGGQVCNRGELPGPGRSCLIQTLF